MSARFFGQITCTSTTSIHEPIADTHAVIDFAGGYLAHRPALQVLADHNEICLALGEPRFDDPAVDAIAQTRGIAAAWLEAWRAHGNRAPAHVRGRFAVVRIDRTSPQISLATDRFGTWPICYAEQAGRLHFADRADSLPGGPWKISPQAVFDYLYFHMIPAPSTILAGVARLPAGHVLEWTPEHTECTRYWHPHFIEDTRPDLAHSQQRFRDIIEQAVTREARDRVVGTFLSGGTDSSTVCGMLCRVLGQPARAYSIGFDANGYDEMAYARLAARHFGADHHAYYVTPNDLLDAIPKVAAHYDQPFGNSSAVPAWICASRARADGIDKLLAGDGGDELFGGNVRYAKQRVFGWYDRLPTPLRQAVLEPMLAMPGLSRVPGISKGASYVRQARVPMPDRMQMYNLLERTDCKDIFEPEFLAQVDPTHPLTVQRDTWTSLEAGALINRMLAWDWKYTLADNDLPKVIGTADLAGIEVGFPFLTDELLEFSLTLPPHWKLKGLTLRWFFKEALRGFLPDEIIAKKKHGFGLPFGVWAGQHAGLKALVRETLSSFKQRGIVRAAFIDELLDTHLPAHPGYYGEMAWILMMLELWLQRHTAD